MRRSRHSKKGFELAIGFIVILIITIVIFTSALYMITKFFTQTADIQGSLDTESQQQIQTLLSAGQPVAIVPSTVTTSPNKGQIIGIGISNTLHDVENFYVVIASTSGFDVDGNKIDGTDQPTLDKWLLYRSGLPTDTQQAEPYTVNPGERTTATVLVKPSFQIDANTPSLRTPAGTYVYKVCVLSEKKGETDAGKKVSGSLETLLNTCRLNQNNLGSRLYTTKVYKLQIVIP
jgi:hypothetical protein